MFWFVPDYAHISPTLDSSYISPSELADLKNSTINRNIFDMIDFVINNMCMKWNPVKH